MPIRTPTATVNMTRLLAKGKAAPSDVLIVEDDASVREAIHDAIAGAGRRLHHAGSIADARRIVADQAVDLVLIDLSLPDGDGLHFAEELQTSHPLTRAMVITGQASTDRAVAAIRAGCVDFVTKPIDVADLNRRIDAALSRQRCETKRERRLTRLRRLCKELNAARHEITQQVDILCNDLVNAYQELATKVQSIEMTGELRTALAEELDLEQVLRRTLEFFINRLGPTNAVVFLPGQADCFTVGGYVNYSHDKAALQFILDQCADDLAPAIAEHGEVTHLTDDEQIEDLIGEMPGWMAHMSVLAGPCIDETGEVLASLMFYRDRTEPYDDEAVELLAATCPMLCEHLVKVIRVHHRHHDLFEDGDEDGGLYTA